jgi:hypothetical protein
MLVAGQRVADQDRVGSGGVQLAVGLIGHLARGQALPAVERQGLRQDRLPPARLAAGSTMPRCHWASHAACQHALRAGAECGVTGCQLRAGLLRAAAMNDRMPATQAVDRGDPCLCPGKSAGGRRPPLVKLSANENPLGTSPQALAAREAAVHPSLYPDPDSTALREALGQLHGIDPARIVMRHGLGRAAHLAARPLPGRGTRCSTSAMASRSTISPRGAAARTPVEAPDRDYGTDVDALLACVTNGPAWSSSPIRTTPPAPTCRARTRAAACRPAGDVLLVLDQAYAEYVAPQDDDGALELAASRPTCWSRAPSPRPMAWPGSGSAGAPARPK